jgi:transketolase
MPMASSAPAPQTASQPVEQAKSGHPGMAVSMTDVAGRLRLDKLAALRDARLEQVRR